MLDMFSGSLSGISSDILSSIHTPSGMYSDILSGILSGILYGIYSDILSGTCSRSCVPSCIRSWRCGVRVQAGPTGCKGRRKELRSFVQISRPSGTKIEVSQRDDNGITHGFTTVSPLSPPHRSRSLRLAAAKPSPCMVSTRQAGAGAGSSGARGHSAMSAITAPRTLMK